MFQVAPHVSNSGQFHQNSSMIVLYMLARQHCMIYESFLSVVPFQVVMGHFAIISKRKKRWNRLRMFRTAVLHENYSLGYYIDLLNNSDTNIDWLSCTVNAYDMFCSFVPWCCIFLHLLSFVLHSTAVFCRLISYTFQSDLMFYFLSLITGWLPELSAWPLITNLVYKAVYFL